MSLSRIQRNTNLSPVPIFSPVLEKDGNFTRPYVKHLQDSAAAINAAPQIAATIPAHSGSSGTFGAVAIDANFLYVCVAQNTWKRVALVSF